MGQDQSQFERPLINVLDDEPQSRIECTTPLEARKFLSSIEKIFQCYSHVILAYQQKSSKRRQEVLHLAHISQSKVHDVNRVLACVFAYKPPKVSEALPRLIIQVYDTFTGHLFRIFGKCLIS